MEIYEQINKETDDQSLYNLLGSLRYNNISILYNEFKDEDSLNSLFKSDYLTNEKLDKWFVRNLLEYESHIDFTKKVSEHDYWCLVSNISHGYSADNYIALQIDSMTDKYNGDD